MIVIISDIGEAIKKIDFRLVIVISKDWKGMVMTHILYIKISNLFSNSSPYSTVIN